MCVKHKGITWSPMGIRLDFIMLVLLVCRPFGFGVVGASQIQEHAELLQAIMDTHKYTESLLKNAVFCVEFKEDIAPGVIDVTQILPVHRVRTLKYLYEPKGRIRIEEEVSKIEGLDIPLGYKTTWTDNLKEERVFSEGSGYLNSISIMKRSGLAHSLRKPTFFIQSGVKPLSQLIQSALDERLPIKVNRRQEDHSTHIVLSVPLRLNDDIYECVYWLDPQKLYYPVKIETYRDGKLIRRSSSVPRRIQDDIWMPREAVYESFDSKGERLEKMTMTAKEVQVNVPELPDSLFDIEIPQGTRVVDNRGSESIQYMVGVDLEADMMLDELAGAVLSDEYISSSGTKSRKAIRVRPSGRKLFDKSNELNGQSMVPKAETVDDNDKNVSRRESQTIHTSKKAPYFAYLLVAIVIIVIGTAILICHLRRDTPGVGRGETR